jgi:HSP20 family protein
MPGVDPEDFEVFLYENVLTIKGNTKTEREHKEGGYLLRERRSGSFYRALRLPDTVDTDQAQPHYEHGVLTITIPKAESKKAKQLKVSVGGRELEGAKS